MKKEKNLSISGNNTEININLSEQAEGSWCPAGSHIQVKKSNHRKGSEYDSYRH
jgi:hypothetical protein